MVNGDFLESLRSMTIILGISANQFKSATPIVVDGEVVAAVQEKRFSRRERFSMPVGPSRS